MSRFEVEIEEIVLEGIIPGERYQFADAFQGELERLFREGDRAGRGVTGQTPAPIQAARSVYEAVQEEVARCM